MLDRTDREMWFDEKSIITILSFAKSAEWHHTQHDTQLEWSIIPSAHRSVNDEI